MIRFLTKTMMRHVVLVLLGVIIAGSSIPVAAQQGGSSVESGTATGPKFTYNVNGVNLGPRTQDYQTLHQYSQGEFVPGATVNVFGTIQNRHSSGEIIARIFIHYRSSTKPQGEYLVDTDSFRVGPDSTHDYDFSAHIPVDAHQVKIQVGTTAAWSSANTASFDATLKPSESVTPVPNGISITIDGILLQTDVPPIIKDGRTLVPLRAIFEALGMEVEYLSQTRTIIGTKPGSTVQLTVDSTQATVNGAPATLDVPAMVIDGRTLVPVRFIAESTGQDVVWDGASQRVSITTK